ncbi:hypothetical protein [Caulifigura coniformis]|nr:hypothetical protein [Caulifigura coniformis]
MKRKVGGGCGAGKSFYLVSSGGPDDDWGYGADPTSLLYSGSAMTSGVFGDSANATGNTSSTLYTAENAYSGAPQANAAAILNGQVEATPESGPYLETYISTSANADYLIDDCPETTGQLTAKLSIFVSSPSTYPWTSTGHANASAGGSSIDALAMNGSVQVLGSLQNNGGSPTTIDYVEPGDSYASGQRVGTEHVNCGASVQISVATDCSAIDYPQDDGVIIVNTTAHASFEVETY